MVCTGYYLDIDATKHKDTKYSLVLDYKSNKNLVLYIGLDDKVVSAYKIIDNKRFAFNDKKAEEVYKYIKMGMDGATSKNGTPVPFKLGAASMHYFKKQNISFEVMKYSNLPAYISISKSNFNINLDYTADNIKDVELDYVELQDKKENISSLSVDDISVRSLEEIALEKDLSWLENKKYYIVNDEETAERMFQQLENYNGIISLDFETTGLKINMFGKYGSKRKAELEDYNSKNPNKQIRVDSLVGLVYCVEPNVSYYFPVGHRKFKNLYSDKNDITIGAIKNIKATYTIGELRGKETDYAKFIRELPIDKFTPDIILMERNRKILTKLNILSHNGSFEYKVCCLYDIDLNLKQDTMLLHQIMYKFRSTRSNRGEPSNLKYLTKVEFGVDQLDLKDFFVDYKEDTKGTVKKGNNSEVVIDFSYMDYNGTKAYAPADGDFALQLLYKYLDDLHKNYKEMEYIYSVEVVVAMAIGYMEFYGLRIDEREIENARNKYMSDMLLIEHRIRKLSGFSSEEEDNLYDSLINLPKDSLPEEKTKLYDGLLNAINSSDKELNLNSPSQVGNLLYNILGYPCKDGNNSVGKKVLKGLSKIKNDDGSLKYPVVSLYREYKDLRSLVDKFFGKLPDFMYPGGFFFSSFGQISTATGRMSCIDEDTLVTTVGCVKKIKDIKVGDLVYCYDNSGNLRIKPVLNVMYNGYKDCIELNWISSGSGKTGSLVCTPEHKIRTKHGGWVEAKDCLREKVYHLHRSDESRPRLFGTNGICEQEQLFIKREHFGISSYDSVVHHIDGNTKNNDVKNLEIKSRSEHSREHTKELVASGRVKYEHLIECEHRALSGKEHPCYTDVTHDDLVEMIVDAKGILTHIDMDFSTFKKKCLEKGVDCDSIVKSILTGKRDISEEEFRDVYSICSGVTLRIANYLGISRWRVDKLKKEFGLVKIDFNGVDIKEYCDTFYSSQGDLDKLMRKYGISYDVCLKLNKSLGLMYTGVTDDEFIDAFFRNKGVIAGIKKELGLSWYKVKSTIDRLGLCYNHSIYSIREVGKRNVYDLEIEGVHNFIANEICVHNCSRPNSQQLPKSVTKIIVPRDNYITVDADFSQIEYRTLVALAKESSLIESFKDPDNDYHTKMASLMYQIPYASVTPDNRSSAKSFNFGIPYGMGFKSLSILLFGDCTDFHVAEAMRLYELYFKEQPNVRKFFETVKEIASIYKFNRTYFNRRRYYSFEDEEGKFSSKKKSMALRQAGNFCIQGTAADIFKIAVARNFLFIRNNNLFGDLLITNLIHDEMLFELNCDSLNIKKCLSEIIKNMQFNLDGFPPLFVGAGVALSWAEAKGKMAEIHPDLATSYIKETENEPLFSDKQGNSEVKQYFDSRVIDFRVSKVREYIEDVNNHNKDLDPAIGNLLGLQFDFGVTKEFESKYTEDNGYTKEEIGKHRKEIPLEQLKMFISEYELDVDYRLFDGVSIEEDVEEDVAYEDDEDAIEDDYDEVGGVFALIDEDVSKYGISLVDLIKQFGLVVSTELKVCGIDLSKVRRTQKDGLIKLLEEHECLWDDKGALKLVFLNHNNILTRTGIYVKDVTTSLVATRLGINTLIA